MSAWEASAVQPLPVAVLGEHYHRYRLTDVAAEADRARSLRRFGQQSPVAVCLRQETPEVVDGFKRLAAARVLGLASLSTRLLAAEERTVKAAIYGLNCTGRRTQEWEEAWTVHALVRDDGLSQGEVAELLGRHKSWVCRRLALVEKLADEVQAELRLGLVTPTMARALVRLPAGNQTEVLASVRRAELTTAELAGGVDLFLATTGRLPQEYLLAEPRQALAQAGREGGWAHDPRLSDGGNRVARRLPTLLEGLARMESWLVQRGRADLSAADRRVLGPAFRRLAQDSDSVAGLSCGRHVTARTRRNGCWLCWPRIDARTCRRPWNGPYAMAPSPTRPWNASWRCKPNPKASWRPWPKSHVRTWRRTSGTPRCPHGL
jgi:ParB-like chromosome segregation protein Spo0J